MSGIGQWTANRRQVMAGAAIAGAAAAIPGGPALAQSERKTFVLVHGGWRGGWCWRPTADLLEAQGHKVFTPTLTGLGERSHLLQKGINLETHTTDVVNVFKYERLENVVLVGHSVGGFVITPVAQEVRELVSSIVFLDAFLPLVGQSANNTASQAARDSQNKALADGEITMPAFPSRAFAGDEANWAWIDSLASPHPILPLIDECKAVDGRESIARKTYIRATRFQLPAFDDAVSRVRNDPTWKVFEMDCGHDVMIDRPQELTDILLQVA